jgi:phosphate transport system protein
VYYASAIDAAADRVEPFTSLGEPIESEQKVEAMSHLEERMEADLNAIRDWVWKIGEDVEHALRQAKRTLVIRDPELAYDIILGDYPINRASRRCDRMCYQFIASYLPGAGVLREIASTLRINVVLERIGDYAVTIAREALQLKAPLPARYSQRIDEAVETAIGLLGESRQAFREGNAETAITLMNAAKRLDARMDTVYDDLFEKDASLNRANRMVIFAVLANIKRIADQSKNICDQTVFAVTGITKLPKAYRILFLDRSGSDLGQLAVAIGRQHHPNLIDFNAATPGASQCVSSRLSSFLREQGLPEANLDTERLEELAHDISGFEVLVSVNGKYSEFIDKVPFHTSALNWLVPEGDLREQHDALFQHVSDLVELIAGPESLRD